MRRTTLPPQPPRAFARHLVEVDRGSEAAVRGVGGEPVQVTVAERVDLVPVGGEPDDAEVHCLQLFESRLVVESEVGGAQRAEAGAHGHRWQDRVRLGPSGHQQMERPDQARQHQEAHHNRWEPSRAAQGRQQSGHLHPEPKVRAGGAVLGVPPSVRPAGNRIKAPPPGVFP